MADVRAEILAASRSRTGWLENSVQNNESQPFVSKVKSTFEEKTITQDNKLASNASKSEAVRRLGSKVSSIATLFQSFSPHKNDCAKTGNLQISCKTNVEKLQKTSDSSNKLNDSDSKPDVQNEIENHQKRFNSARAIFEQLDKNKESGKLSEHLKNDNQFLEGTDKNLSKYSNPEFGKSSSHSSYNSSLSSPTDEIYSVPFCQKKLSHKAESECIVDKNRYDIYSSPEILKNNQSLSSEFSSGYDSHYSPIYEEVPCTISRTFTKDIKSFPSEEGTKDLNSKDKNANKTSLYNDSSVNFNQVSSDEQILDTSMPIYAKVIKKRSKNSNQSTNRSLDPTNSKFNESSNDKKSETLSTSSNFDAPGYQTNSNHSYDGLLSNEIPPKHISCDEEKSDSGISSAIMDNEYENEDLLRISDNHIELVSKNQQDFNSKSNAPQVPSSELHKAESSRHSSDSLANTWENLGISRSNGWGKKTLDDSIGAEDTKSRSFYGNSTDLRDAAGETLAEFECRDNELFFEAVLKSQDQSALVQTPWLCANLDYKKMVMIFN